MEDVIDMEEPESMEGEPETVPEEKGEAEEQRVHERFRINFKTLIRLSDGDIVQAQAIDISMGGIYLEYGAAAEEGKVFELAFDLPFTNEFKRVLVKAKVVRSIVVGSRGVYGLAFVFTEFGQESDKVLDKYLKLRKSKIS